MSRTGRWPALKRTTIRFRADNLTDWAAALTYYGLLSLFPALIALVSIVGLLGDPRATTETLNEIVTSIGPKSAAQTFSGPIESITEDRGAAGLALVISVLVALWSASGYVGAFIRASNVIYETPERRPFWKQRPLQLLITLVMVLLVALVMIGLLLTGPIVRAVAGPIGISSTAVDVWNVARWPVLVAVVITMISLLYYAPPNAKLRGFRWVTRGSVVALAVWAAGSAAFAVYVAHFGSYDKTYGALGGLVALLVWLWITNLAILFGHQLNAERERERDLEIEPRAEPDERVNERVTSDGQLEPVLTAQRRVGARPISE